MYILVLPTLILGSALFIRRILKKKYSFLYLTVLLSAGFSLSIGFFPNILINGDFSSLKEFARSNFTIIIISALFQFFAIALLVKLDLTNYYSSQKKFKS
jgi:hypothetical protein